MGGRPAAAAAPVEVPVAAMPSKDEVAAVATEVVETSPPHRPVLTRSESSFGDSGRCRCSGTRFHSFSLSYLLCALQIKEHPMYTG